MMQSLFLFFYHLIEPLTMPAIHPLKKLLHYASAYKTDFRLATLYSIRFYMVRLEDGFWPD